MNRYSVDQVFDNQGKHKGYAIFDEYQSDYIKGLYDDKFEAMDDCDILNENEELENYREFG